MDVYILNKQFETVALIDDYISLVWVDRFCGAGEFELRIPAKTSEPKFRPNFFVYIKRSEHFMVIEHIHLDTYSDSYPTYVLKGRSMECFLDRRVIQSAVQYDETKLNVLIETILKENLLNPEIESRKVDLHVRDLPESMAEETLSIEFDGETVLEALTAICEVFGYGFKFLVEDGEYVLTFYKGDDRTYGQEENPWKIFSPKFNNLLQTQFTYDISDSCNAAVVCGEEASQTINPTSGIVLYWPQVWATIEGEETGWDRVEKFIDCSSVSRWQGDYILGTTDLKPAEDRTNGWKKLGEGFYRRMILDAAAEQLEDKGPEMEFSAEVDTDVQWKLGRDIFLGDKVEVLNEFNVGCVCTVTEIIIAVDINGNRVYPTFEATGAPYYVNLDKTEGEEETQALWRLHTDFITRLITTESTTQPNS